MKTRARAAPVARPTGPPLRLEALRGGERRGADRVAKIAAPDAGDRLRGLAQVPGRRIRRSRTPSGRAPPRSCRLSRAGAAAACRRRASSTASPARRRRRTTHARLRRRATARDDLLDKFGGHSQAAGLSLKAENLSILKSRLEEIMSAKVTEFDLKRKLSLDAEVKLSDLGNKFISDLEYLEPFGHQNDRPCFYIKNVVMVQKPQLMKDAHVKCHIFADGVIKPVIFF